MPTNKVPSVITAKDGVHIKGLVLAPGSVITSTYTVTTETVLMVDSTGGVFDVDLSSIDGIDGRVIIVQDQGGQCKTNAVTITGGNIIGKNVLNTNYGVLGFVYSQQTSSWYSFINEIYKASVITGGSFTGTPLTYAVTFTTAYLTDDYSVSISGADPRIWTVESKTATGFTINSNSSISLNGDVYWSTVSYGS